eukprot:Opistho-2@36098
MSGHTDHSELNLEAPLLSISFGNSAIFLLGGPSRCDPAVPILIRSGDIVVMAGQSRLCYHGVPRILENSAPAHLTSTDDPTWAPLARFIATARINANVRQVTFPGRNFAESTLEHTGASADESHRAKPTPDPQPTITESMTFSG